MTVSDRKAHWERAWTARPHHELSWYQAEASPSFELIRDVSAPTDAIVDVGGGAAALPAALLGAGYVELTVVDISGRALEQLAERLGEGAARVRRIEADVLEHDFPSASVSVWHDRAVFHFLQDPALRLRYRQQVAAALREGGHAIIGTFALDGPERCSGLPVRRYAAESLCQELGEGFVFERELRHVHVTPAGKPQPFIFVIARRSRAQLAGLPAVG